MENNEQNKVAEPVTEVNNTVNTEEVNETSSVETPVVETVEQTQDVEPQPVVIPKGEKPKINKKKPNPILIILALILLGGACYFEYIYFVKPIINDASANANNTTEGNTKTNTEEKNESSAEIDGEVLVEDETIGKVVAANKKIVSTKDTDGSKDYTYDLYLGNKLLVTNLEYHEDDGYNSDGRIMAKKIGILKDSETDAKYLAFTVYSSPTKYANITFFVVDKDGKVMYKRTSNSNGIYQLSEAPNGYAYDTLYIIDGDTVLFYEENHDDNSLIAKNIKVNSGVVNVTIYKTYTSAEVSLTGR